MKVLRCESCGAPITNEDRCEYCGSLFRYKQVVLEPEETLEFYPLIGGGCYTMSCLNYKLYGRS